MSSTYIAKRAGITYRQLDHWVRTGFLSDDGTPPKATGSGTERDFTDAEIRRLLLLARLVKIGVVASRAAEFARFMVANDTRTVTVLPGNVTLTIGL